MPINSKVYGSVCGLLTNLQSYMHSGQNIAKIFTCVRYFTWLEKLPGAVLWNEGRRSNEEPLCKFIGNSMVRFSSNSSYIENDRSVHVCTSKSNSYSSSRCYTHETRECHFKFRCKITQSFFSSCSE